ncbi:MAG: hypothetical protein A2Y38_04210 [Spirochaetes bacterium GWB1_59_5]|nr:MAG: hypothetical protein A2Y38_04210 [Spirochaetes bacterium GWB1_59_5]
MSGFEQGVYPGGIPYDGDRDAAKLKPHIHRNGLSFRTEGFWVKANKADPARGTDYSPRNWSTTVKTEAAQGATTIALNSVKGLARYQQVTMDRAGTPEVHYITAIDVSAKTITIQEGLTNAQAVGKTVDFDRVQVTYAAKVTTINFFVTNQSSTTATAGADIKKADVRVQEDVGWAFHDRFDGDVMVPIGIGSAIAAVSMCDECYVTKGTYEKIVDAEESATSIDPNYWLRIKFTSAEDIPTEKELAFTIGLWRA